MDGSPREASGPGSLGRPRTHVARWDFTFTGCGSDYRSRSAGHARRTIVDAAVGATHSDLTLCSLAAGGSVGAHLHSFEQCAYVLGGRPVVSLGERDFALETGDFVLFPVGSPHAWHNRDGSEDARWLEVSTPQPSGGARSAGGPDTFFLGEGPPRTPTHPRFGDPTLRHLGHYLGTPPQLEALRVAGPVRGRAPAGMDTAVLAYSGISVKMMVDANFGADLLTMFMVDYEPGGAAQVHDHPFEEAYFFLEGEIEGEVDGEVRTYRAGEVLFCGVGVVHGFFNSSPGRVRWIETQAPQPPRRHSYRWPAHWEHLGAASGENRDGRPATEPVVLGTRDGEVETR